MLMCKSRYIAKCAESTLCSLSLPGFRNVFSWQRETDTGLPPSEAGKVKAVSLDFFLCQKLKTGSECCQVF